MTKNTEYASLAESLIDREQIEAALVQAKEEYSQAREEQDRCQRLVHAATEELLEKINWCKGFKSRGERSYDPEKEPEVQKLRQELNTRQDAAKAAEDQVKKLNDQVRDLEAQLRAHIEVSVKGVLSHQQQILSAERTVQDLEEKISQQEAVISQAKDFPNPLPDLEIQREDLLAALETGQATEKELAKLDAEIDSAKADVSTKNSDAKSAIGRAQQTINGLNRQLEKARADLAKLEVQAPSVLVEYLRTEAEEIGAAYVKHALTLIDSYKRLVGIDRLIQQIGGSKSPSVTKLGIEGFRLPTFNLNAFSDIRLDADGRALYSADQMGRFSDIATDSRAAEIQHLEDQGVNLP